MVFFLNKKQRFFLVTYNLNKFKDSVTFLQKRNTKIEFEGENYRKKNNCNV